MIKGMVIIIQKGYTRTALADTTKSPSKGAQSTVRPFAGGRGWRIFDMERQNNTLNSPFNYTFQY